jgi:hypothetical protein
MPLRISHAMLSRMALLRTEQVALNSSADIERWRAVPRRHAVGQPKAGPRSALSIPGVATAGALRWRVRHPSMIVNEAFRAMGVWRRAHAEFD